MKQKRSAGIAMRRGAPPYGDIVTEREGFFRYNLSIKETGNTEKISRTALHAWQVSMIQPFTGKVLRIQAPIPKDFFDVFPEIKKMHEAEESIIS